MKPDLTAEWPACAADRTCGAPPGSAVRRFPDSRLLAKGLLTLRCIYPDGGRRRESGSGREVRFGGACREGWSVVPDGSPEGESR